MCVDLSWGSHEQFLFSLLRPRWTRSVWSLGNKWLYVWIEGTLLSDIGVVRCLYTYHGVHMSSFFFSLLGALLRISPLRDLLNVSSKVLVAETWNFVGVSCIACQVSHIMQHVSHIMHHVSCFTYQNSWQRLETLWELSGKTFAYRPEGPGFESRQGLKSLWPENSSVHPAVSGYLAC